MTPFYAYSAEVNFSALHRSICDGQTDGQITLHPHEFRVRAELRLPNLSMDLLAAVQMELNTFDRYVRSLFENRDIGETVSGCVRPCADIAGYLFTWLEVMLPEHLFSVRVEMIGGTDAPTTYLKQLPSLMPAGESLIVAAQLLERPQFKPAGYLTGLTTNE